MIFFKETEFKETPVADIPMDWDTVKFGNLFTYFKGKKPEEMSEGYEDNYLPYLSTGYLRENEITKFAKISGNVVLVDDDDLLLLWDGSNAGEFFLGKKGILSSTMVKIELKEEKHSHKFLFYLFKMRENYLKGQTKGTGVPHVDGSVLNNLILPVPSLSEQRGIVEVLSVVDLAIGKVDEVIAKTERLKKGLMQELLTKGIGHKEFKDTKIGKIPKEWEIVKLGKILVDVRYGTSMKANTNGQGLPVLGIPNILGGKIDETNLRHVNLPESEKRNLKLEDGDILLVRTNANPDYIGRCALFEDIWGTWIYASYLIRIRPDKKRVIPAYLVRFLQSERARRQFLSIARTSAGNYNINSQGIQSINICLAKFPEQQKNVEILSVVDTKLEFEKKEKEKLERVKRGLMDLLLTGKVRVKVAD